MGATRPRAFELGSVVCMQGAASAGIVAGGHHGHSDGVELRAVRAVHSGLIHIPVAQRKQCSKMFINCSCLFPGL
jgi:hypothetical protein